jgi:hypothetical protein
MAAARDFRLELPTGRLNNCSHEWVGDLKLADFTHRSCRVVAGDQKVQCGRCRCSAPSSGPLFRQSAIVLSVPIS